MRGRTILPVLVAAAACTGTPASGPEDDGRAEVVEDSDGTDAREARCSPPEDASDDVDCPPGLSVCYGFPYHDPRCVDTANDPAYCGCCGSVCTAPSCTAGVCDECAEDDRGVWRPISALGASARAQASAVWTGSEMIVWGGRNDSDPLATGERYDPLSDSWRPVSEVDAPEARGGPVAVWTGSEMIVWGGVISTGSVPTPEFTAFATGGRYDPATDSWRPTSTVGAPRARFGHKAVWTGREMIVWGGTDYGPEAPFGDGGRYDPVTDAWRPVSMTNAPSARYHPICLWTGEELIVLGGYGPVPGGWAELTTGGRYDPVADRWTTTSTVGAPPPPLADGVWTGTEVLVLPVPVYGPGGARGGRYLPDADRWLPATAPCDRRHSYPSPVWTGTEVLVWGGTSVDPRDLPDCYPVCGGMSMRSTMRWSPAEDRWTLTASDDAPDGRQDSSTVWTGSEFLVWGGYGDRHDGTAGALASGGRFRP